MRFGASGLSPNASKPSDLSSQAQTAAAKEATKRTNLNAVAVNVVNEVKQLFVSDAEAAVEGSTVLSNASESSSNTAVVVEQLAVSSGKTGNQAVLANATGNGSEAKAAALPVVPGDRATETSKRAGNRVEASSSTSGSVRRQSESDQNSSDARVAAKATNAEFLGRSNAVGSGIAGHVGTKADGLAAQVAMIAAGRAAAPKVQVVYVAQAASSTPGTTGLSNRSTVVKAVAVPVGPVNAAEAVSIESLEVYSRDREGNWAKVLSSTNAVEVQTVGATRVVSNVVLGVRSAKGGNKNVVIVIGSHRIGVNGETVRVSKDTAIVILMVRPSDRAIGENEFVGGLSSNRGIAGEHNVLSNTSCS
jgi:hypothetical protein